MSDYTPMTDDERIRALALSPGRITYLPGSPDKRFARHLVEMANSPDGELTSKQREYMARLEQRYRKQLAQKEDQATRHS